MSNDFSSGLLSSISERGRTLLRRAGPPDTGQDASDLIELCEALLSGAGEASGTAIAREVLDRYHHLDEAGRISFFQTLARSYGPDQEKLQQAIEAWRAQPTGDGASDLHFASEPRRQELFRRVKRARTAVFYSISNCQRGLGGITFGNFLIKQVVEELRRELPRLENFVTLSPVPGFMQWLKSADDLPLTAEDRLLFETLEQPDWVHDPELAAQLRSALEPLAAYYFLKARTAKGRLIDPVARFHLGNGARLERINWLGDTSPKALRESAGIMVNYLYRLEDIEKNHEAYANHGEVAASGAVKKLLKGEGRRLRDVRSS